MTQLFADEEDESSGLWEDKSVKPPLSLPHLTGEFRDLANVIHRVRLLLLLYWFILRLKE